MEWYEDLSDLPLAAIPESEETHHIPTLVIEKTVFSYIKPVIAQGFIDVFNGDEVRNLKAFCVQIKKMCGQSKSFENFIKIVEQFWSSLLFEDLKMFDLRGYAMRRASDGKDVFAMSLPSRSGWLDIFSKVRYSYILLYRLHV